MAQAQSKPNWFAIGISIVVVVVLVALGGVVVWMNNQATDAGPAPKGELINSETGALTYGDGEDTVAVYIDFMCPICNQFEQTYGEAMQKAVTDGEITLEYHPIAILDHYSTGGSEYSSRSANAMFCVAEKAPDKALDYMESLFTNQPAENTAGRTDEELAGYAEEVGAGAAADCIADGTYKKWGTAQASKNDIKGTPTVEVNGERLDMSNSTDFQKFTDLIS
ncbi:DsbA family protein [Microbacterium sp. NPDC058342]|uniref:DsbA family protein n=1 Tax=Microbacterium sp. NPDC058342 TaxID=3346454 RepID=UPI003649DAF6